MSCSVVMWAFGGPKRKNPRYPAGNVDFPAASSRWSLDDDPARRRGLSKSFFRRSASVRAGRLSSDWESTRLKIELSPVQIREAACFETASDANGLVDRRRIPSSTGGLCVLTSHTNGGAIPRPPRISDEKRRHETGSRAFASRTLGSPVLHVVQNWTHRDLNPGPFPCQGNDLPLIYEPAFPTCSVPRLNPSNPPEVETV